jgi:CRP/FNR family transcriptional regulator, cyclic AMP receptor protein
MYIQQGNVKLTVVSEQGKEAVVAIVGPRSFFGEGCLNGHPFASQPRGRSMMIA